MLAFRAVTWDSGSVTLPKVLQQLRLPVIGSPMFIVSQPDLVLAQCKAGIVGAFPALNARPAAQLETWLQRITSELEAHKQAHPNAVVGPFAVNQIVHRSNGRLMHDLDLCVKYKVPIVITSLGARQDVADAVHSYGGIVLHDVTTVTFAKKALERGADGLIAVCAGAGGHAGTLSPFALVQEIRSFFAGPLILAGAIASGRSILAAQALGADLAYMGSAFIATEEAHAVPEYKEMVVASAADDIIYTNTFSGVHANYLRPSIVRAGLDPATLPSSDPSKMDFGEKDSEPTTTAKAWRDIWGCGQGVGLVREVQPAARVVDRLEQEYRAARSALASS